MATCSPDEVITGDGFLVRLALLLFLVPVLAVLALLAHLEVLPDLGCQAVLVHLADSPILPAGTQPSLPGEEERL